MRRQSERRMIAAGADVMTCPVSPAEREVVEELKRATAVTRDANLIRVALWTYCRSLVIRIDPEIFALDQPRGEDVPRPRTKRRPGRRQAVKA
jgi:hypothetical protein